MGSGRQEDPMLGCGTPIRGGDSELPIQERGQRPHPEPSVPLFHLITGLLFVHQPSVPGGIGGESDAQVS